VDPDPFINFAQDVVVGNDDTTVDEQARQVSFKFYHLPNLHACLLRQCPLKPNLLKVQFSLKDGSFCSYVSFAEPVVVISEEALPAENPAEGTSFAQGSLVLFMNFFYRACCGDVRGRGGSCDYKVQVQDGGKTKHCP
jgi:hypothetical protein